jgi:hypothetical protein
VLPLEDLPADEGRMPPPGPTADTAHFPQPGEAGRRPKVQSGCHATGCGAHVRQVLHHSSLAKESSTNRSL